MASPSGHSLLRHCNQSQDVGRVIASQNIRALTSKDLKKYTDDFSERNLIGLFQFGRVYRGTVESDWAVSMPVTVKIWDVPFYAYNYVEGDNEMRMMDEFILLRHKMLASHPGMVKLYGYCLEGEHVGVVYDFESKNTVQNLIVEGGFTWLHRVKVALGFAELLVFMHTEQYQNGPFVLHNIEPSHIMVDKNYNPKLFDFGLITGGIFAHERRHVYQNRGCLGSIDEDSLAIGKYSPMMDVFGFGILLMKLMGNKVDRMDDLGKKTITSWAYEEIIKEYNGSDGSDSCMTDTQSMVAACLHNDETFFHEDGSDSSMMDTRSMVAACLRNDKTFFHEDGVEMSRLACDCTYYVEDRPTMKEVLDRLLKLQIVEKYYDQLRDDDSDQRKKAVYLRQTEESKVFFL